MEKAVSEQELKERAVAPRVTQEHINALLARVKYVTVQKPEDTTSTFVHAFLDGKFFLGTGFSACVDPANFKEDIGLRIATKDAESKATAALWGFEGYALYKALNPEPTTYIQRLEDEYEENNERLVKLQELLSKPQPSFITDDAWAELVEQYPLQDKFVTHLRKRLVKAKYKA